MTFQTIARAAAAVSVAGVIVIAGVFSDSVKVHANEQDSDYNLASIGLKIAPSFINARGRDPNLVGLGSFIVNAQADCNGCHGSDPANEFLPNFNPFSLPPGQTLKFNQATYLNGGQDFGPVGGGKINGVTGPGPDIISRNLTPDYTGNPEGGDDLKMFMYIIRTGHDTDKVHPNCLGTAADTNCYFPPVNGAVLQVMPWPKLQSMTDHQLTAIWTYLSTVPCNAHNDALGMQYPWLQNQCSRTH